MKTSYQIYSCGGKQNCQSAAITVRIKTDQLETSILSTSVPAYENETKS